jgi:glycosyltransferase involved in cell wall biosynthesis
MTNHLPLITVTLSTHNEPLLFVQQAVESMLAQTYQPLEFVFVIDDPTNTPVVEYLTQLVARDNRVTLRTHTTSLGLAACRNEGIFAAKGEYVALMDADDISEPERILRQYRYMQANPCDLLFTHMSYISDAGERLSNVFTPMLGPDRLLADLLTAPVLAHPTALIRKDVFATMQYDPSFRKGQDTDLWIRAIQAGFRIDILPEQLLQCRIHRSVATPEARLERQLGYARYGLKIVAKHYRTLWRLPAFWFYALKRTSYYLLLTLPPKAVLKLLMRLRDRLRA